MVAVQHGMVYRHTPEYDYPRHPGVLRPAVTCTFGPEERDLLVASAGYPADAVVVTGSPRESADGRVGPPTDEERQAIRNELGVRRAHCSWS